MTYQETDGDSPDLDSVEEDVSSELESWLTQVEKQHPSIRDSFKQETDTEDESPLTSLVLPENGKFKGMAPITDVLNASHPDAAKYFKNQEAAITKKANEINQLKKQIDSLKTEIQEYPKRTQQHLSKLKQEYIDPSTIDLTDDSGWQKMASMSARKELIDMYEPELKSYQEQVKKEATMQFIDLHQEFEDPAFFDTVINFLETNPGYQLEHAYKLVKADYQPVTEQTKFEQTIAKRNETAGNKTASRVGIGGRRPSTSGPDFSNCKTAADYAKALDPHIDRKLASQYGY